MFRLQELMRLQSMLLKSFEMSLIGFQNSFFFSVNLSNPQSTSRALRVRNTFLMRHFLHVLHLTNVRESLFKLLEKRINFLQVIFVLESAVSDLFFEQLHLFLYKLFLLVELLEQELQALMKVRSHCVFIILAAERQQLQLLLYVLPFQHDFFK